MESRRLLLPWPPSGGIDAAPFPEGRKRRSVSRSGNGPSRRRIVMEALPPCWPHSDLRSVAVERSLLLFVSQEKCDVSVLATEEVEFLCLLLPPVFFATFGRFPWLAGRPPRCRSKGYDKQRGEASREKARFVIRGENAETFQLQPAAGAAASGGSALVFVPIGPSWEQQNRYHATICVGKLGRDGRGSSLYPVLSLPSKAFVRPK